MRTVRTVRTSAEAHDRDSDWRQSPRKRAEVALIATLGYPVDARALTSTWTWKVSGAEHVDAITSRAAISPSWRLWHGRILAATPYFQRRGIVAMTSENFDGEWIARHHRQVRLRRGARIDVTRRRRRRCCSW